MANGVIKANDPKADSNVRFDHPVANENMRAHQRSYDNGHREWVDRAKKYDRLYLGAGDQWEEGLRKTLEAQGRPALEINLIMGQINSVLAEVEEQQVEWNFAADDAEAENGVVELNALARRIRQDNDYSDVEMQVVADGIIQDRGYFDIRMDFSETALGRCVVESVDPVEIELSPDAKEYNPDTWPEVTRTRWMSLNEIGINYGEKHRQALEDNAAHLQDVGSDTLRFEEVRFGDYRVAVGDLSEDDAKIREARIVERQHKQLTRSIYLVDLATGDESRAPDGMTLEQAEKLAEKVDSLFVQRRFESRVRWTVSCGGYLIHDDWSPYKRFTIVPFFPIFRRGRPLGLVANQVSPQEQVNKLESQFLHVINTTANSGWIVEAGSLVNMTTEELEARGAETGLVLVHRAGKGAPQKIDPNRVPTGLDHAANKAAMNLRVVSGMPEQDAVEGEASLLGDALSRRGKPIPAVLAPVLRNLSKTRRMVAQRVLEIIQTFMRYPAEFRVRDFNGYEFESTIHTVNMPNADGSTSADMSTGRYTLTITTALPHETARKQQFAYAMEMRGAGLMIPDDYIISISPLDDRQALAERSRQMQGMGEPSEEEQQMAQLVEQLTIQKAMAELQELQAKAQERMSNARLMETKAGATQAESMIREQELYAGINERIAKIKADLTKHMTNMQNKLELAQLHVDAKNDQTRLGGLQKRALEHTRMQGQKENTLLQAAIQPRNSAQ